jgi:integrase
VYHDIKKIPGGFSPIDRSCQYYTELRLLNIASEHYLFERPVLSVESEDVYDYLFKREHGKPLKKGGQERDSVTKDTIQRELTRWRAAFNRARKRNGEYKHLPNPFEKIDLEYVPEPRDRILKKWELKKLLDACEDCHEHNRVYVPLAIFLSVETGMREGEILSLRWNHINFDERTILVTETKTRKVNGVTTRTIVLPFWSMQILSSMAMSLQLELRESGFFNSDKYIFSTNEEAFIQVFADVVRRVKKNDEHFEHLQFRDLRRTAASRFNNEVRLTESEVDIMLGHYSRKNLTRSVYVKTKLDVIRELLDKYTLKQMPLDLFVHDPEALLKMPMKEAFERIPVPSIRTAIKLSELNEKSGRPPHGATDVLSFVKAHASKY